MKEAYKSAVYTNRPDYADFAPPSKFEAVKSIIAKRLTEYPKAICSYSGGADSDILIDLIERTRRNFGLPPIKYVFFNTGLEMRATKDHVKAVAEKYGVEIQECRPKVNIVTASGRYGIPFISKIMSAGLSEWQKKGVPLSIPASAGTRAVCAPSPGRTTPPCASPRRVTASTVSACSTTSPTRTKPGTRSITGSATPTPTRSTASPGRAAAAVPSPTRPWRIWRRSAPMSPTWSKRRGASSARAASTAGNTTIIKRNE